MLFLVNLLLWTSNSWVTYLQPISITLTQEVRFLSQNASFCFMLMMLNLMGYSVAKSAVWRDLFGCVALWLWCYMHINTCPSTAVLSPHYLSLSREPNSLLQKPVQDLLLQKKWDAKQEQPSIYVIMDEGYSHRENKNHCAFYKLRAFVHLLSFMLTEAFQNFRPQLFSAVPGNTRELTWALLYVRHKLSQWATALPLKHRSIRKLQQQFPNCGSGTHQWVMT